MKWRVLGFLLLSVPLLFISCGDNALNFLAKEDSDEACRYQTSRDLDEGRYDVVLQSACADDMQKGASWFGKAGYDITSVIKRFSEASGSKETSGTDPLNIYMSSLVGNVTNDMLTNLRESKAQYAKVNSGDYTDNQKKDAHFYVALVDAVKSLSILKSVIGATGLSSCDINNNGTPDDADAVSCALFTAASQSCAVINASVASSVDPLALTGYSQNYKGIKVQINNLGGKGSTDATCTGAETAFKKKLIYSGRVVTTGSTLCDGDDGKQWPCPLLGADGQPLGLVGAIQESLTSSSDSLARALGASDNDVAKAINEINSGACGTDQVCDEAEIAKYIQNIGI